MDYNAIGKYFGIAKLNAVAKLRTTVAAKIEVFAVIHNMQTVINLCWPYSKHATMEWSKRHSVLLYLSTLAWYHPLNTFSTKTSV